jgi:hypothetical protein
LRTKATESLREKTNTVGGRDRERENKKEKKVEIFELTKSCRLDKSLVDVILQNLPLLRKNTEKYFPSPEVSSLDWARDLFLLSAFGLAEVTVEE